MAKENFNQAYEFCVNSFKSYIQEKFQLYPQDEMYLGYDVELQEEIEGFKEYIADLQEAYYDLFGTSLTVKTL